MIGDSTTGLAAGIGQSFVITETEAERLSRLPSILNHKA